MFICTVTHFSPSDFTPLRLLTWQRVTNNKHAPALSFSSPPYLSINDLKVKHSDRSLFICLKDDLSFHFTFPPVSPAAHCQKSILLGTVWSYWSGRNSQTEGANQGYWDGGPRHAPKTRQAATQPAQSGVLLLTSHARTHGKGMQGPVAGQVFVGVRSERQNVWRGRG